MSDNSERRLVKGWHGRYFEDFEVGDIYKHPFGRTVTETDNVWFTTTTMNTNPIHFNSQYAEGTEFGERISNGLLAAAIIAGMSVIDVSINVTANLGYEDFNHYTPVFHGDTLYAESEILEKRESDSRPHSGIVTLETTGYNQNNDCVLSFQRSAMVLKREFAQPSAATPPGWPNKPIGTQPSDLEG